MVLHLFLKVWKYGALELNQACTLGCVDLMYSSKCKYLCVLSFDINFFSIDITIAKLPAAKVRFLKKF